MFKLQLHIFQLEEYSPTRFLRWIFANYTVRTLQNKKPLVWTQKAKRLYCVAIFLAVLQLVVFTALLHFVGLILGLLLATQPYIFLVLAFHVTRPYEIINRIRVRNMLRRRILELKKSGLVVIGITGSYGKTTTKEFLYKMLRTQYKVLKTPESYNTLFGIRKVIDYELDEKYGFFVCEMGAYVTGEIKELCDVMLPDHGILTGINEQHLERFGSIENTVKAKFELIQALGDDSFAVLNSDNELIMKNYSTFFDTPTFYGQGSPEFAFRNLQIANGATSVDFIIDGKVYETQNLKVSGYGNISNILGAATMAYKLGISVENILKTVSELTPPKHRLEIKSLENGTTLIDDAYSSNVAGFENALDVLASFADRPRVLVTPGIVELGDKTVQIHEKLGEKASSICDYVLLVGESDRTAAFKKYIIPEKVIMLNNINELWNQIEKLKFSSPVILLENDLPDNY